ncbi:MAG TPA: aminotransferase class V-fold PLP-dependent enzyme [Verrucomicrobiae bacterium]|nr:aminotransferase class V-fold PLP-dependent enzyme [Verrucomicrobiae bacterium]
MTVNEILTNEGLRQEEFPVARNKIFLGHAGVCALPKRVTDAISAYAAEAGTGDQEHFAMAEVLGKGRSLASRLLNCEREEVAFVGPTSLALSVVASGLKFRRTDNVLIYFDDYPSNVYPWMALASQGVEVRLMNIRHLGAIRAIDVMGQVDENTRLVALASCHFISGYRIDIPKIGKFLRDRKILFCVDGIQTVGAFPTTVEYVDMLAADAHKWMLGPCAAGLLYVRREVQERVNPALHGWHNVRCPDFVAQEEIVFQKDARKFELGTHNLLGIVGLNAAMELLLEVGVENIAAELLRKRALLVPELVGRGYSVLNADGTPESASGIVSFNKAGSDMRALHDTLTTANVSSALRKDRKGNEYVRFAPHFYNTDAELERAVSLL